MTEKSRSMTSVFLSQNGKMLLLFRQGGTVVNNVWVGSAGGHFEANEMNDPKACILREMNEELGLTEADICDLTLRYITLRHTNGEIRQNYYFFAELNEGAEIGLSSNEGELRWFDISEVTALEMPVTAKHVICHYLSEGMNTDKLYGGVTTDGSMMFAEME